ncbi:unnamed protein product, partial [Nesidiocoris tenuis]
MPKKPEPVLEKFIPYVDTPQKPVEDEGSPKVVPLQKPPLEVPEEERPKLVMGKGSPKPQEDIPEKTFVIKQGELGKEEPEKVELKPWKKERPEEDSGAPEEPKKELPKFDDVKERKKQLKLPLRKTAETEDELTEESLTVKKVKFELQQPVSPLPPRFLERIQPIISEEEKPIEFRCVFEGFPRPKITWTHNGQEITETEEVEITVTETVAILRIRKVRKSDVGTYSCRASNPAGVATCTANLVIIEKEESGEAPKFVEPLKPKIAKRKSPTELECTVTGLPNPEVRWFRANEEIVPDRRRKIVTIFDGNKGRSVLTIVETIEEDEEIYSVRAVNKFGKAECRANLVLGDAPDEKVPERLEPPKITKPLQAQVVPKDSPVTLEAEFVGSPKLTVKWYRNGKEIEIVEEEEEIIIEERKTILKIKKTTKKKTGKYEVRVTNKVGEARTSCTVKTVETMGTKLYKKPEWVVNMEEMQEKLKGNRKAMSNDSLEHDDCVACEDEDRSSEYDSCCEDISREEAEEEEEDYDSIPYKHDSFYLLPPIEEKSEPSSSDHDKSSDIGKRSLSLSELSRSESANFEYRSMTFPRSKTTEEAYAKEMGDTCSQQQTLHRTLYPLEPRELDPESFHQLHTADSSEELQEFLLLESQCMDSDGGLAAAFLEQPSVVIWYHNDKLLRATENIEISIKDNRSTVVIKRVKEGDAGTYVCKASSNIGEAISTAQIKIVGYGEVTEEEVQEIKEETVQVRKMEKKKKKKVKQVTREEPEKDSIDVEEVQPLESTAPFTETTESAIAERTFDIQESVEVSAVASCKKVSDEQDFPTDVPDTAQVVAPVQESVTITETVPEDKTVELTVAGEKTEKAEVTRTEQRSVTVSQTVTESAVSDLVTETRTETKATESTETLQTAQVSRTTVSVSEIEEALEGLNVKEFGPWQAPLRELAKVDVLRKKGVSVEEVLTLYDTGELPALKTAPAQNALVSLVERVGHSSLISEMVTQEETLEGTLKGVFKAFLTMVDLRSATVQEVIPLFRPRDFQTPHWETVSTMPVTAPIEEVAEDLETSPDQPLRGLPLSTSQVVNEAITQSQLQLLADSPQPQKQANLSLVPHTVVSQQITKGEEKEDSVTLQKPEVVQAQTKIDSVEPFSITETRVHSTVTEFTGQFVPKTQEVLKGFVPNEGVEITETTAQDSFQETVTSLEKQTNASFSLITHEAMSVTETSPSLKEGHMAPDKQPISANAGKTVIPQEGLMITEVNQGQMEDKLSDLVKPTPVKPKEEFSSQESIMISEVHSETKPEKYFPERVVPTETAHPSFVQQQTTIIETVQAPEKEGDYVPGRLPPSQVANLGLSPRDSLFISDSQVHEREDEFIPLKAPDESQALEKITTQESVQVSSVQHQDHTSLLKILIFDKKKADVDFTDKESLITTQTTVQEKEESFEAGELPNSKTALPSVSSLETSSITETTIQESEGELAPRPSPQAAYADTSLRPQQPITVTETTTQQVTERFDKEFRYKGDTAETNIQEVEAKQIHQVLPQESEAPLKMPELPQHYTLDQKQTDSISTQGVETFTTEIVEKEGMHALFEKPDEQKGKVVPSHPLQSLIVEQAMPEGSTKDLKKEKLDTVASLKQIPFQEVVTEMTVCNENLAARSGEMKLDKKEAGVTVLEEEGITVTEVVTDSSLKEYASSSLPEAAKAQPTISSQKIASKSEVSVEDSAVPLDKLKLEGEKARAEHLPHETIAVSAPQVNETEAEWVGELKPDQKTAVIKIGDSEGINIEQVICHDKELELKSDTAVTAVALSTCLSGHKIASQFETVPDLRLGKVDEPDLRTEKAKVESTPLQEVVITETNITETESELKEGLKHKTQTVNVTLTAKEGLSVTEVVTEDKEKAYKAGEIPESRTAELELISQEVAQKEEVITGDETGVFERVSPIKEIASLEHTIIQCAVASESQVNESEGLLSGLVKPDEKSATMLFEKGDYIKITEVSTIESEKPLEESITPKAVQATSDLKTHKVASSFVTHSDVAVGKIDDFKAEPSLAQIQQSGFEAAISNEMLVRECEGKYEENIKPDTKTASATFLEEEGLTVSMVTSEIKEGIITEMETPKLLTAEADITAHSVAERQEVVVETSLKDFGIDKPELQTAVQDQTPFQALSSSETAPIETEGSLSELVKPDDKKAGVSFEDIQSVSVSEVVVEDQTAHFSDDEKPVMKTAKPNLTAHEIVQKEIVITESSTGVLDRESPTKGLAQLEAVPYETVVMSEVASHEREKDFEGKLQLNTQTVETSFITEKSVNVSTVNVEDRESALDAQEKPKSKTAIPSLTGQEIAEMQEVTPIAALGALPDFEKAEALAKQDQIPFESISSTQPVIREKEGILLEDKKPFETIADLRIEQNVGVQITQYTLEDKENEYASLPRPEGRKATVDIIPQEVLQKEEVITSFSTSNVDTKTAKSATAVPSQLPFHTVETNVNISGDTEGIFENFVRPEGKTADTQYESAQSGIIVSEITTQEKESLYEGPIKPKGITAETEVISKEIATKSEVFIGTSTKELEKRTSPERAQAISEHLPFQSIQSTETSTVESEAILEKHAKPSQKKAGIEFVPVSSLAVTQTIPTDKEVELQMVEKHSAQTANKEFTEFKAVTQSETVTVTSAEKVSYKQPIEENAEIGAIPHESIVTSEVAVKEHESEFVGKLDMKQQMASTEFEAIHGVRVTQVITDDKEKTFTESSKPKTASASVKVPGRTGVQVSQVTTEVSVNPIEDFNMTSAQGSRSQIPYETPVTLEQVLQEKEGLLDEKVTPESKIAEQLIDQLESVQVTSTITTEKEKQLPAEEKPKPRTAEASFPALSTAEVSELVLGSNTGDYQPAKPIMSTATTDHLTFESISQTEVLVRESMADLKEQAKPEEKKAGITMSSGKTVTISQIIPGDKEETYTVEELPRERMAQPSLSEMQDIAAQTYTMPLASVAEYTTQKPELQEAVEGQELIHGLIVSEHQFSEQENEFHGKFKPETKQVGISLEEGKKVQTVTEVVVEDREGDMMSLVIPEQKRATPDVVTQQVVEVIQTFSETSTGDIVTHTSKRVTAFKGHIPFETYTQQEPIIQECEDDFESIQASKKSAGVGFEEGRSVTITEVETGEGETPYTVEEGPESHMAQPSISGTEVAQKSVIITELGLQELTTTVPQEATALAGHVPMQSVVGKEIIVSETEKEFEGKFKPVSSTADVSFESQKVITISTVETEEREMHMRSNEKPEGRTAVSELLGHDVAEKFEILAQTAPQELESTKPETMSAQIEHTLHSSLIQTEVLVREGEVDLRESEKRKYVQAEASMEQIEGVNVTVTQSELKETALTLQETPTGQKASTTLISQESLQQTITDTSISEGTFESQKPLESTAQPLYTPFESLQIAQGVVQEQEEQFSGTFKAKPSTASVEFEEIKRVAVSEISAEQREEEFEGKIKAPTATAEPDIVGQEVAQQTQVITESQTETLDSQKPKEEYAKHQHLHHESIIRTEAVTAESEVHFEKKIILDTKKASVVVDAKEGITVSQTVADHKEQEYTEIRKTDTLQAAETFLPQEAVQQTEAVVSMNATELGPSDRPKDLKVTPTTTPHESLETSEVRVQEQEKEFSSKWKPDTSSADTIFQETKSLQVTQITAEEHEEEVSTDIPKTEQARPNVSDREIATKTEVIPGQELGDLTLSIPSPLSATPSTPVQQHVTVTTHGVTESEAELPDMVTPSQRSGQLNIQEHSGNVVITEVQPHIKEGECSFDVPMNQQTGSIEFVTNTAYSSEQIMCDVDVTNLERTPMKSGHATLAQSEQDALQIETSTLVEKEGELQQTTNPEMKHVIVTIDSTTLPCVQQHDVNEVEIPLHIEAPSSRKATRELIEAASTQVFKNEILDSSDTLTIASTDKKTVDTTFLPNESVVVLEHRTEENPQSILKTAEPSQTSATVNVTQTFSLSVDETRTHETTESLQAEHKPATKTAQCELITHQNIVHVEDTNVDVNLGHLQDEKSAPLTASEKLTTTKVPIVEQVVIGEGTSDLFVDTTFTEFNASPTAIPRNAAQTEIPELKGGTKELSTSIQDESQASLKLVPNQVFTTQDSTLLENIENLITDAIVSKNARTNVLAREIATTEETTPQQQPDILKTSETMKENATTDFIPQTSTLTEEVIVKEQTSNLHEISKHTLTTANTTVSGLNVATSEQTLDQNTVTSLDEDKKKTETAHPVIDAMEAIETSETTIHDVTGDVDTKPLQQVTAKRRVDSVDSVQHIEVQAQEIPAEYTSEKVLGVKSQPKFDGMEIATTEETISDSTIVPLKTETSYSTSTATENFVGQNILQQESTMVQETMTKFDSFEPTKSKLEVNISAHEFVIKEITTEVQQDAQELQDEVPKVKRATTQFEVAQTIQVDTSVPIEHEEDLPDFHAKETKGAGISVNKCLKVPLSQLTSAEDQFENIQIEQPGEVSAKPKLSSLEVAIQEENVPHQTTASLELAPAGLETPKTSFTTRSIAITEESIVQCSTEELTPQATKRSVNADGDLIPHQVAISEDVIMLENVQRSRDQPMDESATANPQLQPQEGLEVGTPYCLETTNEGVDERVDKLRAKPSVVELNLPIQQCNEIFENERNIEEQEINKIVISQKILEGLSIASKTETMAVDSVRKDNELAKALAKADQKLEPTDVISTDEVIAQETVKEFTAAITPQSTASESLTFSTSLVTEVAEVIGNVESIQTEQLAPRKASTNMPICTAITTEEVTTESAIERLKTIRPDAEEIGAKLIELQAVVTEETDVQQSMNDLKLQDEPALLQVQETLTPAIAICTEDVHSHANTTDIPEDKNKSQNAEINVTHVSAPSVEQPEIIDSIKDIKHQTPEKMKTVQEILPHEHIEIQMPNVLHTAEKLTEQVDPRVEPTVNLSTGLPIAVKKATNTHEETEKLESVKSPGVSQTKVSIPENIPTSVEMTVGQDSLGPLPDFKKRDSLATIHVEGLSVPQSENVAATEIPSHLHTIKTQAEDILAAIQPEEREEPTVQEAVGEFIATLEQPSTANIHIAKLQAVPVQQVYTTSEQAIPDKHQLAPKRHSTATVDVEGLHLTVSEEVETSETSFPHSVKKTEPLTSQGVIESSTSQEIYTHEIVSEFKTTPSNSETASVTLTNLKSVPQIHENQPSEQVDLNTQIHSVRKHSKAGINVDGLSLVLKEEQTTEETPKPLTLPQAKTDSAVGVVHTIEQQEPSIQETVGRFHEIHEQTTAHIDITNPQTLAQVQERIVTEQAELFDKTKTTQETATIAELKIEALTIPANEETQTEEALNSLPQQQRTAIEATLTHRPIHNLEPTVQESAGEFNINPMDSETADISISALQAPLVQKPITADQLGHGTSLLDKRHSEANIVVEGLTLPTQEEVNTRETSSSLTLPRGLEDDANEVLQPSQRQVTSNEEIVSEYSVNPMDTASATISLSESQQLPLVHEQIPSDNVDMRSTERLQGKQLKPSAVNAEVMTLPAKEEIITGETSETLPSQQNNEAEAIGIILPKEVNQPSITEVSGEFQVSPTQPKNANINITQSQSAPIVEQLQLEETAMAMHRSTTRKQSTATIGLQGLALPTQEKVDVPESSDTITKPLNAEDSAVPTIHSITQMEEQPVHEIVGEFNLVGSQTTRADLVLTKPHLLAQVQEHLTSGLIKLDSTDYTMKKRDSVATTAVDGLSLPLKEEIGTEETSTTLITHQETVNTATEAIQLEQKQELSIHEIASEFIEASLTTTIAKANLSKPHCLAQTQEMQTSVQVDSQVLIHKTRKESKAQIDLEGLNVPANELADTREALSLRKDLPANVQGAMIAQHPTVHQETSVQETISEFAPDERTLHSAKHEVTRTQRKLPLVEQITSLEQTSSPSLILTNPREEILPYQTPAQLEQAEIQEMASIFTVTQESLQEPHITISELESGPETLNKAEIEEKKPIDMKERSSSTDSSNKEPGEILEKLIPKPTFKKPYDEETNTGDMMEQHLTIITEDTTAPGITPVQHNKHTDRETKLKCSVTTTRVKHKGNKLLMEREKTEESTTGSTTTTHTIHEIGEDTEFDKNNPMMTEAVKEYMHIILAPKFENMIVVQNTTENTEKQKKRMNTHTTVTYTIGGTTTTFSKDSKAIQHLLRRTSTQDSVDICEVEADTMPRRENQAESIQLLMQTDVPLHESCTITEVVTKIHKDGRRKRVERTKVVKKIIDNKETVERFEEIPKGTDVAQDIPKLKPVMEQLKPVIEDSKFESAVVTEVVVETISGDKKTTATKTTTTKKVGGQETTQVKETESVQPIMPTEETLSLAKPKKKVSPKKITKAVESKDDDETIKVIPFPQPATAELTDVPLHESCTITEVVTKIHKDGRRKSVERTKVIKKIVDNKETVERIEEIPKGTDVAQDIPELKPVMEQLKPVIEDSKFESAVVTEVVVETISGDKKTTATKTTTTKKVGGQETTQVEETESVQPIMPTEETLPLAKPKKKVSPKKITKAVESKDDDETIKVIPFPQPATAELTDVPLHESCTITEVVTKIRKD